MFATLTPQLTTPQLTTPQLTTPQATAPKNNSEYVDLTALVVSIPAAPVQEPNSTLVTEPPATRPNEASYTGPRTVEELLAVPAIVHIIGQSRMVSRKRQWSKAEQEFLELFYVSFNTTELAAIMGCLFPPGRTESAIKTQAVKMGLQVKRGSAFHV